MSNERKMRRGEDEHKSLAYKTLTQDTNVIYLVTALLLMTLSETFIFCFHFICQKGQILLSCSGTRSFKRQMIYAFKSQFNCSVRQYAEQCQMNLIFTNG